MKTLTKVLVGGAAFGLLLSVTAIAQADGTAALYEKKCGICHGVDGKAETKVGLKKGIKSFLDADYTIDRDRMIKAVTDGIPEEGSDKLKKKGFAEKLSAEEIAALVDHVIGLKK